MHQARLTQPNENEILSYLGYRSQTLPEELAGQIRRCTDAVLAAAAPRAVYRVFPLGEGPVLPAAGLRLEGEDIAAHLLGCDTAILMAATLGAEVERLLLAAQVRSMADALIMDACASAAIENVCDNLEEDLRRELAGQGRYLTDRFSPGYGDMPIAQQPAILAALNAGRAIGLTVSRTNILIPRKSVTAVLGAADTPRPRRGRGCEHCNLFRTCQFRKEGKTCES